MKKATIKRVLAAVYNEAENLLETGFVLGIIGFMVILMGPDHPERMFTIVGAGAAIFYLGFMLTIPQAIKWARADYAQNPTRKPLLVRFADAVGV